MSSLILIQILGLIAMAVDVYATTNKSDKRLVQLHAVGCYIFSIHFFLLGQPAGGFSELLSGLRNAASAVTKSKYLAFLFIGIYTIILATVPDNIWEILPLVGAILATIGVYFFQGIKMRLFYITNFILWLIYSIYAQSIGATILFSVLICTSAVTIFRLLKDKTAEGQVE